MSPDHRPEGPNRPHRDHIRPEGPAIAVAVAAGHEDGTHGLPLRIRIFERRDRLRFFVEVLANFKDPEEALDGQDDPAVDSHPVGRSMLDAEAVGLRLGDLFGEQAFRLLHGAGHFFKWHVPRFGGVVHLAFALVSLPRSLREEAPEDYFFGSSCELLHVRSPCLTGHSYPLAQYYLFPKKQV